MYHVYYILLCIMYSIFDIIIIIRILKLHTYVQCSSKPVIYFVHKQFVIVLVQCLVNLQQKINRYYIIIHCTYILHITYILQFVLLLIYYYLQSLLLFDQALFSILSRISGNQKSTFLEIYILTIQNVECRSKIQQEHKIEADNIFLCRCTCLLYFAKIFSKLYQNL